MKIYITRHGETMWNTERRMQGHLNSELTSLGLKQGKWLEERIKDVEFDLIYSSPLKRAYQTAKIIKGNRDIEIIKDDRLKEIFLGSRQGMKIEEWKVDDQEQHDHFWYQPHLYVADDGEDFQTLSDRVAEFYEEVLTGNKDQTVLIVAHGIILKALFNYINNGGMESFWEGPSIGQASLTVLECDGGKCEFELVADTSHHKDGNKKGAWFMDEE